MRFVPEVSEPRQIVEHLTSDHGKDGPLVRLANRRELIAWHERDHRERTDLDHVHGEPTLL